MAHVIAKRNLPTKVFGHTVEYRCFEDEEDARHWAKGKEGFEFIISDEHVPQARATDSADVNWRPCEDYRFIRLVEEAKNE